uniref:Uncharacterized protein n=1 Tax=viral metagenome TaxID=1070528 RepID=A0A6C0LFB0_9ZZZZ
MDEVMKQSPEHITRENVEIIFKKNNENVIDTLIDLWNIEEPKVHETDAEKDKWANIRDVCDSYDIEMQTHLNRMKANR